MRRERRRGEEEREEGKEGKDRIREGGKEGEGAESWRGGGTVESAEKDDVLSFKRQPR